MQEFNQVALNWESSAVWFNPRHFYVYTLLGDQSGCHLIWHVCSFKISGIGVGAPSLSVWCSVSKAIDSSAYNSRVNSDLGQQVVLKSDKYVDCLALIPLNLIWKNSWATICGTLQEHVINNKGLLRSLVVLCWRHWRHVGYLFNHCSERVYCWWGRGANAVDCSQSSLNLSALSQGERRNKQT